MDQQQLFHESIYDALTDCVRALGGAKTVGHVLWPELSYERARSRLLDALNPEREQKLDPAQQMLIISEAAKVGCLAGVTFINRECRCADPERIEPEDERAALQRQFLEGVKTLQGITARMDKIGGRT
jgi:hypothetical protein